MATQQNITLGWFTGEAKSVPFSIMQEDGGTVPQDITGWSLSWMVKRRKTDADDSAYIAKEGGAGITLTTPTSGEGTITVAKADIASIVGGALYHHELKRTDPGLETVISYGTFMLTQGVHRG